MIGVPTEKFFYEARRVLLKKYGNNHNKFGNIQLFTKIGRIPPYYHRFDEPVISESLSENDVQNFLLHAHPELFTDYKLLISACADDCCINISRTEISLLPENDIEKLQNGFINLKNFLQRFKIDVRTPVKI